MAAVAEGSESVTQSPTWFTRPWGAHDQLTGIDVESDAGGLVGTQILGSCASGELQALVACMPQEELRPEKP